MRATAHHRPPATPSAVRGLSLIELLMGVTILGIALVLGVPSFAEWVQNSQIRSTAESLQNGLQFARSEAVRRNKPVRLELTTSLDNGCAVNKAGTNWVVSLSTAAQSAASKCGNNIDPDSDTPYLLQKGTPVTSNANTLIDASQAAFAFNSLGRIVATTNPATNVEPSFVNINSSRGKCEKDDGKLRCLRVEIAAGGQIRMCDPKRPTGDPMACLTTP